MNVEGIAVGTRLVTVSGDIVELLEVQQHGAAARVRYVEVVGSDATEGTEETLGADEIATVDGQRFIGPPRTLSSGGRQ